MRSDERPTTPIVVPPRQSPSRDDSRPANVEHAANIVRDQIDTIYSLDPNTTVHQPVEQPEPQAPAQISAIQTNLQYANQQSEAQNPYERTHDETQHQIQANAWSRYHSAWQNYYQQYYERYYVGQVHEAKKSLEEQVAQREQTVKHEPVREEPLSTDEAMYDLRSKLRGQIQTKAKQARKSRHFVPIIAATTVMLLFLFLQYNRVLFANVEAYITPGNIDPTNIVIDPSLTTSVSPEPKLIIPKINVDVPIIWDAIASDQNSLNRAMDNGVAWFNIPGANSKPGQVGNFVLSGHSSNDWLDGGNYKFIFARLEQVVEGDTLYVNYEGTRYTYTVTKREVVKPTDVKALTYETDKPVMTLVTCTPLGTALNRLLVTAEQVSPSPDSAGSRPTEGDTSSEAAEMPTNSPTFIERLFGN